MKWFNRSNPKIFIEAVQIIRALTTYKRTKNSWPNVFTLSTKSFTQWSSLRGIRESLKSQLGRRLGWPMTQETLVLSGVKIIPQLLVIDQIRLVLIIGCQWYIWTNFPSTIPKSFLQQITKIFKLLIRYWVKELIITEPISKSNLHLLRAL